MKKILVLAGGYDQIILIQSLKKRGYYVILADYYENPPAKKFSDKHYIVSTLDEEKIKQIAIKENVDMITTSFTDQALLTMAKVSEELSLPCYLTYEQARWITNKKYMKEKFKEGNIPTSDFKIINNVEDLNDYKNKIKFPIIVKPCDCNSSKGVKKVNNFNELIESVSYALKISRSGNAIIEEYKNGPEYSIDAYIKDGKVYILSITETKKVKMNDKFIINGSLYDNNCSLNLTKIEKIVSKISKAFNLKNTPLLIQTIINDNEINVLEFSARFGGGTKYKIIELLSGINIVDIYLNMILDERYDINVNKYNNCVEMIYLYCNNGIFKELKNFDVLKSKNIIFDYFQYKTYNTVIDSFENSGDRVAGLLIVAKDIEELNYKKEKIFNNIKVMDINDNNILKDNIY